MGSEIARKVIEPDEVGFLVLGERCGRCGDVNYDEATRVCLTCTYPDDPCSVAFLVDVVVDQRGATSTFTITGMELRP